MRRAAIKPSSKSMARRTPLRAKAPMKKRAKRKRADPLRHLALLCYGQPCYLLVPGAPCADRKTVVPCHSNSQADGKGMAIKASDEKTVPGCQSCHFEIDQGRRLDKADRRAIWLDAYARWKPVRDTLMEMTSNDRACTMPAL